MKNRGFMQVAQGHTTRKRKNQSLEFAVLITVLLVKVLVTLLCLTFCDPMDCSLRGSSVHGILQAKILEWVAMPSSRGSSRLRNQTHISYVSCIGGRFSLPLAPHGKLTQLWSNCCYTMDCSPQAPLSLGFSRQEYWSGQPFPSPGFLTDPVIEHRSSALQTRYFTI